MEKNFLSPKELLSFAIADHFIDFQIYYKIQKMSDAASQEEVVQKPKAFDETLESGNNPSDNEKIYEVIVAGGENKKSVEHILLLATLPKEKNLLARLWSRIFSRESSDNPQCKTDEADSIGKWSYLKPMKTRREGL